MTQDGTNLGAGFGFGIFVSMCFFLVSGLSTPAEKEKVRGEVRKEIQTELKATLVKQGLAEWRVCDEFGNATFVYKLYNASLTAEVDRK